MPVACTSSNSFHSARTAPENVVEEVRPGQSSVAFSPMNPKPFAIDQRHYLIVDLEATCSDNGFIPRGQNEIIEIGAVMLAADSLTVVGDFCAFIKPVRHPDLTSFCTQLTSIQQADVDRAQGFPETLHRFRVWADSFGDYVFCSWGDYDRKQFHVDCDYHRVSWPFSSGHLNLKIAFSQALQVKKMGMTQALERLGLPLQGTHHRGIDDARNIARIVQTILKPSQSSQAD